jgi:hypothetical protein
VHVSAATLQQVVAPVQAKSQGLATMERPGEQDGSSEAMAVGSEDTPHVYLTQNECPYAMGDERVLVVRWLKVAQMHHAALHQRLANVHAILHHSRAEGLLDVQDHEQVVRERPARGSGQRAARTRVEREISLQVQVHARAFAQAEGCLGWHVSVTTQPAEQLSLEQAVLA